MNILLINHYAGSPDMGMEFRPYYMAREWVKTGHDVTIVAGDYSHLRMKNPDVQRDFQEQDIDGIRYVWVKAGEYEGNGTARALSMFRFVRKLQAHARELVGAYRPDAVIASSTYPLDTYVAQKIRKLSGAKYVHEIHDMWPATLYEIGGMSRHHPFVMLMQAAENSFCRHADTVVSLLPAAEPYLREHGLKAGKFEYIPNGICEDEWNDALPMPQVHQALLSKLRDEGKFVVGFFGGHALSNGLDVLIDTAIQLKDNDEIAFVLVGSGVEKPALMRRVDSESLTNVHFLSPVEKRCIPNLLSYYDCSYIGGLNSPLYRFGVSPNKMFDSMMAALPLVVVVESVNSPEKEFGCGILTKSQRGEDVRDVIEGMAHMPKDSLAAMGKRGKTAVQDNFTYGVLATKFMQAIG